MQQHIVQSPEWGRFKTEYGTKAIRVGKVQYTVHKIPLTNKNFAYSPKINPLLVDWDELKASLMENKCIAINFDVPNIIKNSEQEPSAKADLQRNCVKSPNDTFAKYNIIMDIKPTLEEIEGNFHKKLKYNIHYAQKKGVKVTQATSLEDFERFYTLLKETALRQRYFIHPKKYYQLIWEHFKPLGMCHILNAEFEGETLASWMLFSYEKTLYYPYGGSSEKHKNLFASSIVAWEAIKLGKYLDCSTFDMWGAAKDPMNQNDPWYGFTNFKMKFGGKHVEYIDSYDLVINMPLYKLFNLSNELRWKILRILR